DKTIIKIQSLEGSLLDFALDFAAKHSGKTAAAPSASATPTPAEKTPMAKPITHREVGDALNRIFGEGAVTTDGGFQMKDVPGVFMFPSVGAPDVEGRSTLPFGGLHNVALSLHRENRPGREVGVFLDRMEWDIPGAEKLRARLSFAYLAGQTSPVSHGLKVISGEETVMALSGIYGGYIIAGRRKFSEGCLKISFLSDSSPAAAQESICMTDNKWVSLPGASQGTKCRCHYTPDGSVLSLTGDDLPLAGGQLQLALPQDSEGLGRLLLQEALFNYSMCSDPLGGRVRFVKKD
ncbi:MAG: hypothetical protein Q8N98_05315, partial [bacterium]|nr:hypothetical protein [bacterium]